MPPHDDVPALVTPPPPDAQPASPSRRSILRTAAGAGAASLAVTALAGSPALAASRVRRTGLAPDAAPGAAEPADDETVVVHVRNVRTGELDVYRGLAHVRVHDRALAARLARVSL
jgi:hypothetical protein